jgi:hypothetical protein
VRGPHGRTLPEVIVAGTLLILVIGTALVALENGQRVMNHTMQKGRLESNARLVANRIVRLLRQTGVAPEAGVLLRDTAPATDTPGSRYTRVEFRVNRSLVLLPGDAGYSGTPPAPQTFGLDPSTWRVVWTYQPTSFGDPTPSPIANGVQAFAFEYSPTDTRNGVDDDKNGIVDEGRLVHMIDASDPSRNVVLLEGVLDDASFAFPSGYGTTRPDATTGDRAISLHFRVGAPTDDARRSGELLNGLDDDGDGQIDEHMLVKSVDEVVTLRND